MFRRSNRTCRVVSRPCLVIALAVAFAGAGSAGARANDAACRTVLSADARYDAGRRSCLAPRISQLRCAQVPGQIRWHKDRGVGADYCEYAVPSGISSSGVSRLPPEPRPGPGGAERTPPDCSEARINIDWVMLKDAGAWRSYSQARRSQPPLAALLYAQRHNARAQESIRRCSGWAAAYATELERRGRVPSRLDAADQPERWGAIWREYNPAAGSVPPLGYVLNRASRDAASMDAMAACRNRAAAQQYQPRCQIVRLFSSGCHYMASGADHRGNTRVGTGATPNAARASCSLGGIVCNTPVGGCLN